METPPQKSGSPSGLLPLALALAAFLASFAFYSVAWGEREYIPVLSAYAAASATTTVAATSSSSVFTLLYLSSAGASSTTGTTVSCGSYSYYHQGVSPEPVYLDYVCTGYSLKISSQTNHQGQVSYLIGTPATASLGEITVDTTGIEEVLVSIGGIGLIALFLYGVGMSHHILSKV